MTNRLTIMAMSFLLLFQILLTSCVSSYTPDDHYIVNCGNSGETTYNDGRNWIGDIDSVLLSPVEFSNRNGSTVSANKLSKTIPYNTARLSRSEFSYSFPVTAGQKFVRLFFYPSSYNPNFLRSDAFFSVKAGPATLLNDFNASLNADAGVSLNFAEPEGAMVREYIVNVNLGEMLNISFTPNQSHPNAYAFVNGIEVVSMPYFLYYSALETVYRIDVGGRQIPSNEDTGMFRYWEQDNDYLEIERPRSISAAFGLNLTYGDDQNYFAPDDVYKTARNYGMNEKSKFSVTWEFEVELEFNYMVRLHFCEFDGLIEKAGDRVFQIFINDVLMEPVADVMFWTQNQRLVPVHRDYPVWMPSDGSSNKLNLSIKLQPHPIARSTYRDVLLNGIEILKLSESRNNLGGFNPNQPPSSLLPLKASKIRAIFIVMGSTSGFVILSLIVLLSYCQLARPAISKGNSQWGVDLVSTSEINKSSSLLPSDLCRCFSISEVRAATNNFDDTLVIGVGGFGNVYKGYIDKGLVSVAIKRLKQGSQQGLKEFQTEIEMLSQLRHHHLVSLIGYCNDDSEMILVYEFMARGTFREHLYDCDNPLSWNQRLEICLGSARGLHYLHTGAKHAIIHRDVKSTNILIDENWMAKISDFGLSKIGPGGISRSNINISTAVKGSIGYLDPEYYMCQRLTEKSDVYSFGVVLLEVLCGRPPILRAVERQQQNLVEWFRRCVSDNDINGMVDPFIKETTTPECSKVYIEISLQCLADDGNERPSMGDVMLGLESVMEMLNKAEKTKHGGTLNEDITIEEG